jgi:hypothetical protein
MMRLEGWEERLAGVIAAAKVKPYVLGEFDCFCLACSTVQALTGRDLWTPWAGSYRSKHEALLRIVEFGGDFTAAFTKLFGGAPMPMALGWRGDVCEFAEESGEQHLGIILGVNVALLGPDGLEYRPREVCRHCWRI